MINLYYAKTPNGYKIKIFLEEAGMEYKENLVDLSKGEQFKPEFLKISPNNKIPAILDTEPRDKGTPISVFESGAILMYLGEKIGKFIPSSFRSRIEALEWLFWQVGGLGPMAGQAGRFRIYGKEKVPSGVERYTNESKRLYGVLEKRLEGRDYIAGEYSIADMACYPWIVAHESHGQNLEEFKNITAWHERISKRPAVRKAYL